MAYVSVTFQSFPFCIKHSYLAAISLPEMATVIITAALFSKHCICVFSCNLQIKLTKMEVQKQVCGERYIRVKYKKLVKVINSYHLNIDALLPSPSAPSCVLAVTHVYAICKKAWKLSTRIYLQQPTMRPCSKAIMPYTQPHLTTDMEKYMHEATFDKIHMETRVL